jgi:hypothetical protein
MGVHWRSSQSVCFTGRPSLAFSFARQSLISCVLLFSILFGPWMCLAQSGGVSEYEVKAAFLYDFARFVDWPPATVANDKSPFVLCVVGADPFGSSLDTSVKGQRIDQHEIAIRRMSRSDDLASCRIAFISRSESKYLPVILNGLKASSTLLIGDAQDFARRGGGIQLYLEDNAVHFSINVDSVQRAHLAISSNVLALATIVHDVPSAKVN